MLTSGRIVGLSSVVGLLAIAFIAMNGAAQQHQRWQEVEKQKAELEARAELEQTNAELTKKTAEAYRKNQVVSPDTLIVRDYTSNTHTPPSLDWQHSVDPGKKTFIYDQYRNCVGFALGGRFTWNVQNGRLDPNVCKEANQL